jgi:hypothetical protein
MGIGTSSNWFSEYEGNIESILQRLADNEENLISAKDVRDAVWSLWSNIEEIPSPTGSTLYTLGTPSNIDVGGVKSGTTFSNITFGDLLDRIFISEILPTAQVELSNKIIGFGQNLPTSLSYSIDPGTFNLESGYGIQFTNGIPSKLSTELSGNSVNFNPTFSNSNNPIENVTVTMSFKADGITYSFSDKLEFKHKIYFGTIDNNLVPDDNTIKGLSYSQYSNNVNFSQIIDFNNNYFIFCYPTSFGFFYPEGFFIDNLFVQSFTKIISDSDFINEFGISVKYDVWISNQPIGGNRLVGNNISNIGDTSSIYSVIVGEKGEKGETGSNSYIEEVSLLDENLVFTGTGSAFSGTISLSGISGGTQSYIEGVTLSGTNLIFTGTGSAFSGTISLSGISGDDGLFYLDDKNSIFFDGGGTISSTNSGVFGFGNTMSHDNSFIVGNNIETTREGTLFINNLSIMDIPDSPTGLTNGDVWRDGDNLKIFFLISCGTQSGLVLNINYAQRGFKLDLLPFEYNGDEYGVSGIEDFKIEYNDISQKCELFYKGNLVADNFNNVGNWTIVEQSVDDIYFLSISSTCGIEDVYCFSLFDEFVGATISNFITKIPGNFGYLSSNLATDNYIEVLRDEDIYNINVDDIYPEWYALPTKSFTASFTQSLSDLDIITQSWNNIEIQNGTCPINQTLSFDNGLMLILELSYIDNDDPSFSGTIIRNLYYDYESVNEEFLDITLDIDNNKITKTDDIWNLNIGVSNSLVATSSNLMDWHITGVIPIEFIGEGEGDIEDYNLLSIKSLNYYQNFYKLEIGFTQSGSTQSYLYPQITNIPAFKTSEYPSEYIILGYFSGVSDHRLSKNIFDNYYYRLEKNDEMIATASFINPTYSFTNLTAGGFGFILPFEDIRIFDWQITDEFSGTYSGITISMIRNSNEL